MASIYRLLVLYLTIIPALALPQNENRGRKLFGGYRIVPKVCQPTNPSRIKSPEPPICMFNYECNRRNGEVVGACMDGFLFGACCQLPPVASTSPAGGALHGVSPASLEEIQEIDHVPEVPILLKPDGTPLDTNDQSQSITKHTASTPGLTSQMSELEQNFPALLGQQDILDDLSLPGLLTNSNNNDIQDHQDHQDSAVNPVTTLLSPDQVLQIADPVDQLPALFSQGIGQNNHTGAETVLLNMNGTLLGNEDVNFEQLFNSMNRSTPSTFVTERTSSSTKKMTGPVHYMNTHRVTATTQSSTAGLVRVPTISHESPNKKHDNNMDREEIAINHIISILNGSNPANPSVPVNPPRVTSQQVESTDRTSSVHTWVTIEDTSIPTTNGDTFPYTFHKPSTKPPNFYYYDTSASTMTFKKGATKAPSYSSQSSSYSSHPPSYSSHPPSYSSHSPSYSSHSPSYSYSPSSASTYSSSPGGYPSTRPTTNPPAPTLIVLGPLGTEFTTITSPKPLIRRTTLPSIRPNIVTKQPSPIHGTEITHNISTVISTSPGASGTSNIISTSYINVDLKERPSSSSPVTEIITMQPSSVAEIITKKPSPTAQIMTKKPPPLTEVITKKPTTWTTVSLASKPSFQLKPQGPDFQWPENLMPVQTLEFKPISTKKPNTPGTTPNCDEITAPPDDLSAFPPDRNPSLTDSSPTSQQEKPTIVEGFNNTGYPGYPGSEIITDNEIPTPSFIEDGILKDKVDDLVNKIVDSLQGDFQNLEDVIYRRKKCHRGCDIGTNEEASDYATTCNIWEHETTDEKARQQTWG
uniref:POLR2A protein n=1 Tax=Fopius arisanus TaxID=64838 RepID=A0A0C9QFN6_9HYME